jgi:hypothetical protein
MLGWRLLPRLPHRLRSNRRLSETIQQIPKRPVVVFTAKDFANALAQSGRRRQTFAPTTVINDIHIRNEMRHDERPKKRGFPDTGTGEEKSSAAQIDPVQE